MSHSTSEEVVHLLTGSYLQRCSKRLSCLQLTCHCLILDVLFAVLKNSPKQILANSVFVYSPIISDKYLQWKVSPYFIIQRLKAIIIKLFFFLSIAKNSIIPFELIVIEVVKRRLLHLLLFGFKKIWSVTGEVKVPLVALQMKRHTHFLVYAKELTQCQIINLTLTPT